jgi:signal transduction histidine kinase/ligand-binding sensor domain-containing protein
MRFVYPRALRQASYIVSGRYASASIVLFVAITLATPATARERLIRFINEWHGLEVTMVSALAQDSVGLLWIGTPGGLQRYDGRELRHWARDTITTHVTVIRPTADGALYVIDRLGTLYRVAGEQAEAIPGIADVEDVLATADGGCWIVAGGSLRRRDAFGRWSPPVAGLDDVRNVRLGPDGAVWAASRHEVWRLEPDRPPALVIDARGIVDLLPAADGSLRLALFDGRDGRIVSAAAGQIAELAILPARPIAMAWRDDVLWASFDQALVVLRSDEPPEILAREQGIRSGGPLLVDREGSLWMGTFQGIVQLPEPETWFWGEQDGLPAGPRFLARSGHVMWVATWNGLGVIDLRTGSAWSEPGTMARTALCADGRGRIWTADEQAILEWVENRWVRHPFPGSVTGVPEGCTSAPDGAVWLSVNDRIYHVPSGGDSPVPVAPPAAEPKSALGYNRVFALYADHRHRLWASKADLACWVDVRAPITPDTWTCRRAVGSHLIRRFVETEAGTIWAATDENGVYRMDERSGEWTPMAGATRLSSRNVLGLVRSPRGGTWVLGHGSPIRVLDRSDLPDGWDVVERLGTWHGLLSNGIEDLIEDAEGMIWLTSTNGVTRVPRSVRDSYPAPPAVTLLDARIDGISQPITEALDLPYRKNRLELTFAALSYRDPGRLRYRVRLDHEAAWSEPTTQPSFRFVDLPPGAYRAEVSASLDGHHWSVTPARIDFYVQRPWYRQAWAITLFVIGALVAAYAIHRARLAFHLRLERQRARIAMDLHDEVGSALGSIGILASVASSNALDELARRDLTERIAATAGEVSESMGDIVWSLRKGSTTLEALAAYLADRAARMFPDEPTLERRFPTRLPIVPLSLAVCRNVQSIALEAMHNAARHARAHRVGLGLVPGPKGRWRLWIEDDGVGLTPHRPGGAGGLGLDSMRRRAAEIRAELTIGERPGGGTRVELTFDPAAPGRPASHERGNDSER